MRGIFLSAAMFTFAFGSGAFASKSYSGGGDWNSNQGMSGQFTMSLNSEKQANGDVNIIQDITVANQSMVIKFTARPVDDMRFKIVTGDKTIGWGYCWRLGDVTNQSAVDKICHYHLTAPGGQKIESSLHITNDSIHEMGSIWDDTQKLHIAWKGILTLVTSEE